MRKKIIFTGSIILLLLSTSCFGAIKKKSMQFQPIVVKEIFEKAKKNESWKIAFVTGEKEQVVFMNISPSTNPKNEIGSEIHPFDQLILVAEGNGKVILGDTTSSVKEGDLIFIPKGTQHNVINLDKQRKLKLISFYSENDIPKDAEYKTKDDETKKEKL